MTLVKLREEDNRSIVPNYWHTVETMTQTFDFDSDPSPVYTIKCRVNVQIPASEVYLAPEKLLISDDARCPECKLEDMNDVYAIGAFVRERRKVATT